MMKELSGLSANLVAVAEVLEVRATRIARDARKAADTWKPYGPCNPAELMERVGGLIESLDAAEVVQVVAVLRGTARDPHRLSRTLGTLLRLTPDPLMVVVATEVADGVGDAMTAVSLDVLYAEDLRCLRMAVQTVRGAAMEHDGATTARELRALIGEPPSEAGALFEEGAKFHDLARLSDYSMQLLLRRIDAGTLAAAMVDAPAAVAARVADNQPRVVRRILSEAVEAARSFATAETVREARRTVTRWLDGALRDGTVDYISPPLPPLPPLET